MTDDRTYWAAYWDTRLRLDARNCSKGTPCGNACIPRSKTCNKSPSGPEGKQRLEKIAQKAAKAKASKSAASRAQSQPEAEKPVKARSPRSRPKANQGPPASDEQISAKTDQWLEERGLVKKPSLFLHDKLHTLVKDMIGETSESIAAIGSGKGNKGPDLVEEGLVEVFSDLARGKSVAQAVEMAALKSTGLADGSNPYYTFDNLEVIKGRLSGYARRIQEHPEREAYMARAGEYLKSIQDMIAGISAKPSQPTKKRAKGKAK